MIIWCSVVCAVLAFLLLYNVLAAARDSFKLSGRHVLVTGGSSGIGKEVARQALLRGANVTIVARNMERLQQASHELEAIAGQKQVVNVISLDVSSDYQSLQSTLLQAIEEGRCGPVDVLVNCAGITCTGVLADLDPNQFTEMFKVNVVGSVQPTKVLLPSMIQRRRGRIVFVSSQAGQVALYGYSAYSSSKFALRGLAEALQMEVKPYNILVSVSFPPDTDTPQLQGELLHRSKIANEIAATSGVFQPSDVASDIISGIEQGKHLITHGLDGFMLGHLTAGMSPVHHVIHAVPQVLLMGLFRLISLFYLNKFDKIVSSGLL